jgi:hypothetical protein
VAGLEDVEEGDLITNMRVVEASGVTLRIYMFAPTNMGKESHGKESA